MSARWDWGEADLVRATERARAGHGRQLARLIKATSEDDLARALSSTNGDFELALWHCLGRRQERAWWRQARRRVPS
ncbi:hypothetical protein [uncultured Rhodospira sp.]|uniref:hypothetical protein n=1 Tax=uncultured Rhodospira sp. TaxID=1936189 RepID=UPI0026192B15|nr:hypothetical protein [uncultured Rhodospira sp.]